MNAKAKSNFDIVQWDEKTYRELDGGAKHNRASVVYAYTGEIQGEGATEYLMYYRPDGTGNFVGIQRVTGTVAGRAGTFVLQHEGTFRGHVADEKYFVVPGSGTGELEGLRGAGGSVHSEKPFVLALDYSFER